MATPFARLLRALGGGRLPPEMVRRVPKSVVFCKNPAGPDFHALVRSALGDLTKAEEVDLRRHLRQCAFCVGVRDRALARSHASSEELRELLEDIGTCCVDTSKIP